MFSIFIQQTAKNNNLTLSGSQTLRTMTGTSREHIIQSQFIWHYKKEPANWWPSPAHRTNQLIEQSLRMQPVLPENTVLAQLFRGEDASAASVHLRCIQLIQEAPTFPHQTHDGFFHQDVRG